MNNNTQIIENILNDGELIHDFEFANRLHEAGLDEGMIRFGNTGIPKLACFELEMA